MKHRAANIPETVNIPTPFPGSTTIKKANIPDFFDMIGIEISPGGNDVYHPIFRMLIRRAQGSRTN
jgi:hypothetical protein